MDKMVLAKKLGEYIYECRIEQNMTQAELAREIGFTAQFLGRIENGAVVPSKKVLQKIILCLDLEPAQIKKIFRESVLSYVDDLYKKKKRK